MAGSSPALAQTTWGSIPLPGGVAAAREVAPLGRPDRPPVNFLVDLARAVHTQLVSEAGDPPVVFLEYIDYLHDLKEALDRVPGSLVMPDASEAFQPSSAPVARVLSLIGLRLEPSERGVTVVAVRDADATRRAVWLSAVGIDARAVGERLARGETVAIRWRDDQLPFPLPGLWRTVVFEGREPSVRDLMRTRNALLFYLGLVNLDRETLAWLGSRPDVFEKIYEDAAGPFAVFGRSLHVREAAVVVPGGLDETRLWEDLVGAPTSDPASFVTRLLSRQDGRLAYFYDTASQLAPASRAFLLAAHLADPTRRSERSRLVRRVYDRFANVAPNWRTRERPFFRPVVDPALVLAVVDVEENGTVGPSWWTAALERAVGGCSWTREAARLRRRPADADANWLLGWVFDKNGAPDERLAMLRLLQRRFGHEPESAVGDIEVALCARLHMPALALSLDRMGVERPALYAEVALASRRLTRAGGSALPALKAWQAGIALVEQSARHRRLSPDTVERALSSLVRAAPERPGDPHGSLAAWVFDELLPCFGVTPAEEEDVETAVLDALSGVDQPGNVVFEWEGIGYRLDTEGAAARSAIAVRNVAAGLRLEHLRVLLEAARRLDGGVATAGELDAVLAGLRDVSSALVDTTGRPIQSRLGDELASVIRALERPSVRSRLSQAGIEYGALLGVVDLAAGEVLPAMAYALAMSPAAGPAEIYAESYRFHDLGEGLPAGRFEALAWAVPKAGPRSEGGSRVGGAMLGLDLARASDRLRRVFAGGLVDSPVVTEADYVTSTARLALRARDVDWETSGRAVAEAIGRGRRVVSAWAVEPPAEAVVEERLGSAAVSAWRISFARWLLRTGDAEGFRGFFTMTDFYRLGTSDDLPDAWGQSAWLVESCWCLRAPMRRPPEDWLGRTASLAAFVSSDLLLRLTELLAQLDMPHALLEPLLPMALQDTIDHAQQISTADWEAFAWPRHLEAARVESYLLALLADGLLAAPGDGVTRSH